MDAMGADQFWASLPPDQRQKALAEVLRLGGLNQQNDTLNQQIQEAIAGSAISPRQYSTGAGAALGGLGDVLREISGSVRAHHLRGEQEKLRPQIEAARQTYAQALLGNGGPPIQRPTQPQNPFGLPPLTLGGY